MAKTTLEELSKLLENDLVTFLKNGNIESYSRKIDEDLNIDNLDKLLKIHFLLKEEVLEFVRLLPERIRRIKTSTLIIENESNCEIRGNIIWDRTLMQRMKSGSSKGTEFITRNNERNYAITENLVLDKLLSVINSIIEEELKGAFEKGYSWILKWINQDSKKVLQDIYYKNIYLRRIKDHKSKIVTERMIDQTTRSRNILYQTSANILLYYRKLMDYDLDKSDAIALLNSTFIKPDKVEVLFELYWTIKLIKNYSKDSKPNYLILDKGNNIVAKWEDDQYSYKIFHDSTGSYRFFESLEGIDLSKIYNEHIKRDINSKRKWIEYRKEIFKVESADGLWGGRPDIILEQCEKNTSKLCRIIIGEVKYTQNENYASIGLKELMEYMSFIKDNDKYLIGEVEEIFNSDKIIGILCFDGKEVDKKQIGNIRILTTNDNMDILNV